MFVLPEVECVYSLIYSCLSYAALCFTILYKMVTSRSRACNIALLGIACKDEKVQLSRMTISTFHMYDFLYFTKSYVRLTNPANQTQL